MGCSKGAVEVVQGGIESGSGRVDPTKDADVYDVLDSVHFGVDLVDVGRGLVQRVGIHGADNGVGEVCGGREGFVAIRIGDGVKRVSSRFQANWSFSIQLI